MRFYTLHSLEVMIVPLIMTGAAMVAATSDGIGRMLDIGSQLNRNESTIDTLLGNRAACVSDDDKLFSAIRSATSTVRKVITLCGDTIIYMDETAHLSNLIIDFKCASSGCTLDGSGLTRILSGQNSVVSLNGIQLQNGYADTGDGGALDFKGSTIKLINSYFVYNTVSAGNGGVIALTASTLTLENAIFEWNTASSSGGAMYLVGSTLTATTGFSSFYENSAFDSAAMNLMSSTSTMKNVYFGSNNAEDVSLTMFTKFWK
jgi:hypothetical protein